MSPLAGISRPQGRFWPTDEEGRILNDASADAIDPMFCHAIAQAVDAYRRNLKTDLHSIYVSGSVARGLSVVGQSNLDMVAVLQPNVAIDPGHTLWLDIAGTAALAGQNAARGVDMTVYQWHDIFGDANRFSLPAFILATTAICVSGPDIDHRLPRTALCPAIANSELIHIEAQIDESRKALVRDPSAPHVRDVCRRLARKVIHAAFALVMLDEGEHTRDLDLARDLALLHYPQHAHDMDEALALAYRPVTDARRVADLLDRVKDWLVSAVQLWLDTHNPSRLDALPLPQAAV